MEEPSSEELPDIPLQASWLRVTPRSSGGAADVRVSATIAEDDPPLPSRTEEIITLFRCAMDPPKVRKVPMTELVRACGCLEDIQTMATKPCSDEIDELAPVLFETCSNLRFLQSTSTRTFMKALLNALSGHFRMLLI
jgi:hypothetical protein